MQDALIIGAGLGGLFTGAILAKEGLHVTIIEKNATIGGGLQSFQRFGEVFDTGMHVVGGMQPGGNIRRICEYLGIFDDSLLCPDTSSQLYVAEDGAVYDISEGREGFIESLSRYFPHEHENIVRYVDALFRLSDELPLFRLRPDVSAFNVHSEEFYMPADAFISRYISDPKLRSVVAYMTPMYSGVANTTPAFMHSIISALCINGTSRFVGGSSLFADKLRDVILAHGGEVHTSEGVCKISTQGKKVVSVTTTKGREFTADYYISAIHPATLIQYLDNSEALPKAYKMRLEQIPNTYSAFTLNIKFKPETFRHLEHTVYFTDHYGDEWHYGDVQEPIGGQDTTPHAPDATDDAPETSTWPLGFLYMTPPEHSALPSSAYARKMIVTAPMAWSHVKQWEDSSLGHRPADYKAWKEHCAEAVIERLERIHPGFRDCIEAINTASPLTIRDYYGVKHGSMCGYQKDSKNITMSHLAVTTKIPNLLLTGQCIHLHGFCGVPLTAIKTCEAILGENHVLNKIQQSASSSVEDSAPSANA